MIAERYTWDRVARETSDALREDRRLNYQFVQRFLRGDMRHLRVRSYARRAMHLG